MASYEFLQWFGAIAGVFFCFVSGAVVGSFLNVVVYRLPQGINLILPASRCPACETPLSFRENLPIIGWLRVRGRCVYCHTKISAEYPIVEFITASFFALIFILWFMDPSILPLIGINPDFWRPDWAGDGFWRMWPTFVLACMLVSTLIAVTLIDARTYHIHLALPWLLGAVGLVAHPVHAAFIGELRRSPHLWVIPVVQGPWLGGAIGALVGLGISSLALKLGVLRRSFRDYEEWEKRVLAGKNDGLSGQNHQPEHPTNEGDAPQSEGPAGPGFGALLMRTLTLTGPAVAGLFFGFTAGHGVGLGAEGAAFGFVVGLIIGLVLRSVLVKHQSGGEESGEESAPWLEYPHARREMVWEIVFLLPCAGLAVLGWWLVDSGRVLQDPPLWVLAGGGAAMGLVVGAGVVWAVRILGTLAFGREAMGMGDVHLMGGVGAVVGWIDVTLAFFIAPFLGIVWFLLSMVFRKAFERQGTALPFGPQLAAATVFVVVAKPVVEVLLSWISGSVVDLP